MTLSTIEPLTCAILRFPGVWNLGVVAEVGGSSLGSSDLKAPTELENSLSSSPGGFWKTSVPR